MREVKFRVWCDGTKRWAVNVKVITNHGDGKQWFEPTFSGSSNMNYDLHLMQYTGLKDKNGKEIYEGDIIADDCDTKYLIVFKGGCFYGQYDENDGEGDIDISNKFAPLEVIGNIHENLELI